jgi:poly(beta-D-mannuronate) lyase
MTSRPFPLSGASRIQRLACGLLSAVMLVTAPPLHAQALRSPFAIPAAPKGQKKAGEGRDRCEAPPAPIRTLATTSMYDPSDPTHSKKDPKANARYQAAIQPVRDYAKDVTKFANNYVRSGAQKTAFAECTLDWLATWAQAGGLTDLRTPQAIFNMGQLVGGFAMAYLQVRDNPYLDPAKKQVVEQWMQNIALQMRDSVRADEVRGKNSSRANHRYWSGYGVGMVGVAVGNRNLLEWGLNSARIGLSEIQPDGTLPRELRRASRSRDYHIFSVAPLVMLAEVGLTNGVNLYAEQGGSLHRLVKRILDSNKDASYFERLTGYKQQPYPDSDDGIPSSRLGWLEPYAARFPSEESKAILRAKRPVSSTALGGNMTLLYTGKDD